MKTNTLYRFTLLALPWFKKFRSNDEAIRQQGIREIAEFGSYAVPILCQLLLDHVKVNVRKSSAEALALIPDRQALPVLQAALEDNRVQVLLAVARTLRVLAEHFDDKESKQAIERFDQQWSWWRSRTFFWVDFLHPISQDDSISGVICVVPTRWHDLDVINQDWFIGFHKVRLEEVTDELEWMYARIWDNYHSERATDRDKGLIFALGNRAQYVMRYEDSKKSMLDAHPAFFIAPQPNIPVLSIRVELQLHISTWGEYPDVFGYQDRMSYQSVKHYSFVLNGDKLRDKTTQPPGSKYILQAKTLPIEVESTLIFNRCEECDSVHGIVELHEKAQNGHFIGMIHCAGHCECIRPGAVLIRDLFWKRYNQYDATLDLFRPEQMYRTQHICTVIQVSNLQ